MIKARERDRVSIRGKKDIFLICGLFVFVGFLLSWSSSASAGLKLSDKEVAALAGGKIVRRPFETELNAGVIGGSSFALVNATPDEVFRAIMDVSVWPEIFPNTFDASVVRREGNVESLQLTVGFALFQTKLHTVVIYDEEAKRVRIRLNEGKDNFADSANAEVRLLPQPGGRTLVVYMVKTKVPILGSLAILGDDIVQRVQSALLNVPKRLKRWVEKTETKNQ